MIERTREDVIVCTIYYVTMYGWGEGERGLKKIPGG